MVYILLSISIRDLLVLQTLTVVGLTMQLEGVVQSAQVSFRTDFVHNIELMLMPSSYLWDMQIKQLKLIYQSIIGVISLQKVYTQGTIVIYSISTDLHGFLATSTEHFPSEFQHCTVHLHTSIYTPEQHHGSQQPE